LSLVSRLVRGCYAINQAEQGACGACKSCQLWLAQSHPDYRFLEQLTDEKTGKTSQVIKVDQVRQLLEFLNKSAQLNGYRVAIIHRAENLNVNAANSLLKTLEEAGCKNRDYASYRATINVIANH
jgi:DNA polymerase-3 subunit delta'